MQLVLNGILLSKIDYSESSLILKFYTKEEGLVSFLFQGGKKKKGNALFPLSIAEINCYKRSESNLSKISSVDIEAAQQSLYFDPIKSSVLFFIAEILTLTIKNEEEDAALYGFLEEEIRFLNVTEEFTNYPIYFLLQYSKFLGFYPQKSVGISRYFDLEEGEFTQSKPIGHKYLFDESVSFLNSLVEETKNKVLATSIPKNIRKQMLQNLIVYYKFHQTGSKDIKSLQVLEEILLA